MIRTRFTELVGCSIPIQQAAIGSLATPPLASAVANAGGLGMVCAHGATPTEIAEMLDTLRGQTSGVFGFNFILYFFEPSVVRECVAAASGRARVVEFFYSDPDPSLIELVHRAGALVSWQIGSRAEALAAAKAGCDLVIAQGIEAGGHIRGHISTLALLGQVLPAVRVPVLAAGGIGTGPAMAAVLAAGADGVRVGTRFVAAEESDAHTEYVEALIAAEAQDTVYTDAFSVGWPDAPHRVLRTSLEAAQAFQGDNVAELLDPATGEQYPIRRFATVTPRKSMSGAIQAMPHWAGESVGGVKRVQPAAEIVHELANEAEQLLRGWSR